MNKYFVYLIVLGVLVSCSDKSVIDDRYISDEEIEEETEEKTEDETEKDEHSLTPEQEDQVIKQLIKDGLLRPPLDQDQRRPETNLRPPPPVIQAPPIRRAPPVKQAPPNVIIKKEFVPEVPPPDFLPNPNPESPAAFIAERTRNTAPQAPVTPRTPRKRPPPIPGMPLDSPTHLVHQCPYGFERTRIGGSSDDCVPTCEKAAELAGYTYWTLFEAEVGSNFSGMRNKSIETCVELNRYDSQWMWGRQGEGWEGFRDWIEFSYFSPITGRVQSSHWVHEVLEYTRRDADDRGGDDYYSTCCVRGERSRF